jgi:hypothetical protein
MDHIVHEHETVKHYYGRREEGKKKIKYAKSLKIYNYISTEELMKQKTILFTVKMVGSSLHDSAIEKKK